MSTRRAWPFAAPPVTLPKWVRIFGTALGFTSWGVCALLLGFVVFPLFFLMPGGRALRRERFTRLLGLSCRAFGAFIRALGIWDYVPPTAPPGVQQGQAFVLVANHPTLVDVVLLLGAVPGLVSVVKAGLYRNPFMRALLSTSLYLPGPGYDGDEVSEEEVPVVGRMVSALRTGHPVVVFPEGTRSAPTGLRKFRRGAVEAAARAGVPVACLFIGVDPPLLMKGQKWWKVPAARHSQYLFEWLPTVNVAGRDPKEAHVQIERAFQARWERYADEVGRPRAMPPEIP